MTLRGPCNIGQTSFESLSLPALPSGGEEPSGTVGDGVREVPCDIAPLIDATAECCGGSRHIDRSKDAGSQQKRVSAGAVRELASDVASVVDSAQAGVGASRNVDGDEESRLCPQITVLLALQNVRSHDLADVVDAKSEEPL